MRPIWLLVAGLLVAVAVMVGINAGSGRVDGSSSAATFRETFDGDPARPAAGSFYFSDWDISFTPSKGDPLAAHPYNQVQMGPNCEPPPRTHFNDSYLGTVFICRGHLMTGFTNGGYDAMYLTPPAIVDFSGGEAVIRWEQSTLTTSTRGWTNFWITPLEDNLVKPTVSQFGDGKPRNAVAWARGVVHVVRDFQSEEMGSCCRDIKGALATAGLSPDPARRELFEMRISRTGITVSMPEYGYVLDEGVFDRPLSWTRGVFTITHQEYNPTKGNVPSGHDCSLAGMAGVCPQGNTWHWDNVEITPAAPLTIWRQHRVLQSGDSWTLPAPAPDGALLRFHDPRGDGRTQVSFDGGPWRAVTYRLGSNDAQGTVFTPVPAGTTAIRLRNPNGAFMALDPAVWTPGGASQPPPAAAPAPVATPTPAPSASEPAAPVATPPAPAATSPAPAPATAATATVEPAATPTPDPSALGALELPAGGADSSTGAEGDDVWLLALASSVAAAAAAAAAVGGWYLRRRLRP